MSRWLYATRAIGVFSLAAGTQAAEPVTSGPADADLEWIYSCPPKKQQRGCSFICPTGAGGSLERSYGRLVTTGGGMGASHVTKLTIHLRRVQENAQAIFYEYSTMEVPSGNGFAINTGLGTLSCQVSGMTLDYFGPPKSRSQY